MRTIGSLFSGIGGLELGLERAGVGRVAWQCEIDPFCRTILAKHWPDVERFDDVRTVHGPVVDVLCGGFPCQDVSTAGKGAGLAGERSGLWREYQRIIGELRPSIVVVENVFGGQRRWLPFVRRDLHLLGYRTCAYALSAADVGAPHLRKRVFVVAYANEAGRVGNLCDSGATYAGTGRSGAALADTDGNGLVESQGRERELGRRLGDGGEAVADTMSARREGSGPGAHEERNRSSASGWWPSEPDVGRMVDGLSTRLDGRRRRSRLRSLGNAVVPQCAEVIGRIIVEQMGGAG